MNRLLVLIRTAAILAVVAIVAGLLTQTGWRHLTTLDFFWKGIVPLVPRWLLLSPQSWRQVCPVATVNLLVPHLSNRRAPLASKLPAVSALWLRRNGAIVAAVLLWAIVPMRLLLFNTSSDATGILILAVVAIAGFMGFLMPWKSGWCASICPVYPVEKLYGAAPSLTPRDARCSLEAHPSEGLSTEAHSKSCYRCALHCADIPAEDTAYWGAMRNVPPKQKVTTMRQFFTGSFPGFVLAYVLIWGFANFSGITIGSILLVYVTIAVFMFASYLFYRLLLNRAGLQEEDGIHYARRITAITLLVALNIYYITGADGIATVIGQLSGRQDLFAAFMTSILVLVVGTSIVWLRRVWHSPLQPYVKW